MCRSPEPAPRAVLSSNKGTENPQQDCDHGWLIKTAASTEEGCHRRGDWHHQRGDDCESVFNRAAAHSA